MTGEAGPSLSPSDAGRLLAERWGLEGALTDLGSYEDQNFRVDAGSERYVLKIAGRDVSCAWLERENDAVRHLLGRGFEWALPEPVGEVVATGEYHARLVRWVPGVPLTQAPHLSAKMLMSLGEMAGASAAGLADFEPADIGEESKWDTRLAAGVIDDLLNDVPPERRSELQWAVQPLRSIASDTLPVQIVHADVTDYNAVFEPAVDGNPPVTGLIDFGDLTRTWRACDPAATLVGVAARAPADPLGAMRDALRGYIRRQPLTEAEVDALWPLTLARAAACAAIGARHLRLHPSSAYLIEMSRGDWEALDALLALPPELPTASLRAACGLDPAPRRRRLTAALAAAGPVALIELEQPAPLDLSIASDLLRDGSWRNPDALAESLSAAGPGAKLGRWGEVRLTRSGTPGDHEPDTLHLGADVLAAAGTTVRAPLACAVAAAGSDELLLELDLGDGEGTLVRLGGVAGSVEPGGRVAPGDPVALVAQRTGGTPPHVHVQLVSAPGQPSYGLARDREAWLALCPDPSALVGAACAAPPPSDPEQMRAHRASHVASAQELYYERPRQIVRGWRQFLYDADGRPYLDMVNNVAVVGHSHPTVAEAASRQLRLLNTNSRFLYDAMARYAERLAELLPAELDTVFLVNSGSEACYLALQLARVYTGRCDVIALAGAYHGWTGAVYELCTAPGDNPGWRDTLAPWVHVAAQPDPYRGEFGDDAGAYAQSVAEHCQVAARQGAGVAAFISEPMLGNQGAVSTPAGYLERVYEIVRAAGGVCIADEVQVGLGRTGENFWAFEHERVVPDIVTLAKAAGNGHPVGAVVCRAKIAAALHRRAAFFSSPGGGPVSCEVGLAVLDTIADERLQENARVIGARLERGVRELAERHPAIGAVHGRGLYRGVDLVDDRASRRPARALALSVCERMRELGVIVQPTGDHGNVLKVKPPLCLTAADSDLFCAALDRALTELEPLLRQP